MPEASKPVTHFAAPFVPTVRHNKADMHIAASMNKLQHISDSEIQTIVSEGQHFRAKLRAVVPPWKYETKPCVLALQGFSNTQMRNCLLRAIQIFFRPTVLHASQIAKDRWEAVICLHIRIGVIFQFFPHSVQELLPGFDALKSHDGWHDFSSFVTSFETWLQRFSVQVNVIELSRWMDVATVSALDRINAGTHRFGNWQHERTSRFVYEYLWKRNEIFKQQQNSYVHQHVGMDFTIGNMMQVAFDRQNLQLELATVHSTLARTIEQVNRLLALNTVHSSVLQELRQASISYINSNLRDNQQRSTPHTALSSRLMAAIESHHEAMLHTNSIRHTLFPPQQAAPDEVIDLRENDSEIVDLTLDDSPSTVNTLSD